MAGKYGCMIKDEGIVSVILKKHFVIIKRVGLQTENERFFTVFPLFTMLINTVFSSTYFSLVLFPLKRFF